MSYLELTGHAGESQTLLFLPLYRINFFLKIATVLTAHFKKGLSHLIERANS